MMDSLWEQIMLQYYVNSGKRPLNSKGLWDEEIMNNINYVIYGVVGLFGVYLLCLAFHMKYTGVISEILLSREDLGKIKDVKGYIRYTFPAMLTFSFVCLFTGVLGVCKEAGLFKTFWDFPDLVLRLILLSFFLLGLGFFMYRMRNARVRFES